jgi:hypothetical protein
MPPPFPQTRIPGTLPSVTMVSKTHVPVNKAGQRLDYELEEVPRYAPSAVSQRRATTGKPCKQFQLTSRFYRRNNCPLDHSPMSTNMLKYMRRSAKGKPCVRGSHCRAIDCTQGHICQMRVAWKNLISFVSSRGSWS